MKNFDVVIIGSGPGGEKAAIQAAKLDKSVVVIEKRPWLGGAGLHTGTLPSKTLRETALSLAAFKERSVFGFQYTLKKEVKLGELMHRKSEVVRRQMEVMHDHFNRNNVEVIYGTASFKDRGTVLISTESGGIDEVRGEVIVIATGTHPARPDHIPFDTDHVLDSDTILEIHTLPPRLTVIGGGVIGAEYACIFSSLGVKVTLIDKKKRLLPFADDEVVTSLTYWMRHSGITLRLGEEVTGVELTADDCVRTNLKSGKVINSEMALYAMGRVGNSSDLGLDNVGIKTDKRALISVNDAYQTTAEHIYAVGDIIGFPSLASTSREQGRRAVCHAFNTDGVSCEFTGQMPFAVYTIPEISMVGATEEELTEKGVPFESGTAYFNEVARGQITGDVHGMVKLLFDRDDHRLLGVHIIGEKASELIHIGQAVMNFGGTVDYFKDAVFNFPTLTDAYKQAAMNGLNKL